jgi:hypothetical protein
VLNSHVLRECLYSKPELQGNPINHAWSTYAPQPEQYVVNGLECWHAYSNVPDYDLTAIVHGSTRRWDSLFPHSPAGFVPLVPFATRQMLEEQHAWCNRSFETDLNTWAEFGSDLERARDVISAQLVGKRDANAFLIVEAAESLSSASAPCNHQCDDDSSCINASCPSCINAGQPSATCGPAPSASRADVHGIRIAAADVDVGANASEEDEVGKCFWQLVAGNEARDTLFLLLMDPGALDPRERRVSLRLGGGSARRDAGAEHHTHGLGAEGKTKALPLMYDVFDQFGSQTVPVARLSTSASSATITVPAGSARFLTLRKTS